MEAGKSNWLIFMKIPYDLYAESSCAKFSNRFSRHDDERARIRINVRRKKQCLTACFHSRLWLCKVRRASLGPSVTCLCTHVTVIKIVVMLSVFFSHCSLLLGKTDDILWSASSRLSSNLVFSKKSDYQPTLCRILHPPASLLSATAAVEFVYSFGGL